MNTQNPSKIREAFAALDYSVQAELLVELLETHHALDFHKELRSSHERDTSTAEVFGKAMSKLDFYGQGVVLDVLRVVHDATRKAHWQERGLNI